MKLDKRQVAVVRQALDLMMEHNGLTQGTVAAHLGMHNSNFSLQIRGHKNFHPDRYDIFVELFEACYREAPPEAQPDFRATLTDLRAW